jgi:SAM-dependent methyltransferase
LPLAQRGYHVMGVDRSEKMLAAAREKAAIGDQRRAASAGSVVLHQADIRDLDLGQTFDAVISMFAVISYMTSNDDLISAFRTARRHLQPGGLFIFDAWSGLAVLTERPQDRYKIVEANGERIIRFVHPELKLLQHVVDVNYKVLRLRGERIVDEVDEMHPMRFLFPQEVTYYLTTAGFAVERICPFLRLDEELTERGWELAVVAEVVEA